MKQFAPAADRNKDPILAVLREVLPGTGLVLEVGSGTGQHVAHFAKALPNLRWVPSDVDPTSRASVAAHAEGLDNVDTPVDLDARVHPWPVDAADAVVCINMIHISPWTCTLGLLAGAASVLPAGGVLALYGPFARGGQHTAPSNAAFDASLRARDPSWGVRDLDTVELEAVKRSLLLEKTEPMPANNFTVVFRRVAQALRP